MMGSKDVTCKVILPTQLLAEGGLLLNTFTLSWILQGQVADPWALKVDLTSTEEKRKAAQQQFESSEANVAHEKRKMRAQGEVCICPPS